LRERFGGDDFLFLPKIFQSPDTISRDRGFFVLTGSGGMVHLRFQVTQDFALLVVEKFFDLFESFDVTRETDFSETHSLASANVVGKAGFVGNFLIAANPEYLIDELKGLFDREARSVRAEIFRVTRSQLSNGIRMFRIRNSSDRINLGDLGRIIDFDKLIIFVIAHAHIEAGAVLLDEVVFQNQTLQFRRNYDIVDFLNLRDHKGDTWLVILPFLKITAHAVFEIFGFADVQNLSIKIFEEIDAGRGG